MKSQRQIEAVWSGMATSEQPVSKAEWVAGLELLGRRNRAAYRKLREIAWQFVVDNSAHSDFPRKFS